MPHNYYLLLDKTDGKLRILPWDVNEAFGTFTMGSSPAQLVDWDIDQPWIANRRLLERLFATESFPKLYRAAITDLNTKFTPAKMFPRIAEYKRAVAPHVAKYDAGPGAKGIEMGIEGDQDGYNQSVERRVLAIKPFITHRHASVEAQLNGDREGVKIQGRRRR